MSSIPADDTLLRRWRAETPGAAAHNHLNNAGASLAPAPVSHAINAYLAREAELGGYETEAEQARLIESTYASVGALLNAAPRNVALVENATVGFALALSAFDFAPGDVIVTTRNDYISNQLAYLSLVKRLGVRIVRAADLPSGGADPDSVRALLRDGRTRLLAVTWVPTNSGLVQPVEALGDVAAEAGVPYLVDACQAIGQLPIDVTRLKCDFLSATGRKFLRGPRGTGFLYVSDSALARGAYPLHVDMRGAKWVSADAFELVGDAHRFENWEYSYALVVGLGTAARYALEVGIERGGGRARSPRGCARSLLRCPVSGCSTGDPGPPRS